MKVVPIVSHTNPKPKKAKCFTLSSPERLSLQTPMVYRTSARLIKNTAIANKERSSPFLFLITLISVVVEYEQQMSNFSLVTSLWEGDYSIIDKRCNT